MAADRPKKMQRISQACDLCHRRSIRCRPSAESPQERCQNCYDFAVDCTYNRPSRRRRNPSLVPTAPTNVLPDDTHSHDSAHNSIGSTAPGASDYTGAYVAVREGGPDDLLGVAWRSFALASTSTVEQYMTLYMNCVYPLYPVFHGPTLWDRIKKRHHLTDRGFFASIMAACALAAARARDGAVGGDKYKYAESPEKGSEIFFAAAQDAIFKDVSKAQGFGYLRASMLLAVTCIQYGQVKNMHQHFGTFRTLSAMQHFHDESYWPQNISMEEREERRRLFWSAYTLDIYASVVFDSIVHSQEAHSNVRYPTEASDEDLVAGVKSPDDEQHWLRGWNFTTDLYRVLEHSVKRVRRNKEIRDDRICIVRLLIAEGIPDHKVMENVLGLYYQLADPFKKTDAPATGHKGTDFIALQAANIQATLQLVRITLFSTETTHDINRKCDVAQNLLETFHKIDSQHLRTISTPLVYHLGSIGQILASAIGDVLCEESYHRVRGLLMSMADLLQGLESGLQPTAGASRDLRQQIDKIDRYMTTQRRLVSPLSFLPIGEQQQRQQQQLQPQQRAPQLHLENILAPMDNLRNGLMVQSQLQSQPAMRNDMGIGHTGVGSMGVDHLRMGEMGMDELGRQNLFDEFQLPAELVDTTAWPWPFEFEFARPDAQVLPFQGFE